MPSILTALSWLGGLSWPVLGSLLPGLSPKLMMALAAMLVALVVVGGPAGAVWLHMHGKQREAVNVANMHCELRIAESARVSAAKLTQLLDTIKTGEDAAEDPKSKAEELAACKKSKLCRENAK
jgi:hypothetical protein